MSAVMSVADVNRSLWRAIGRESPGHSMVSPSSDGVASSTARSVSAARNESIGSPGRSMSPYRVMLHSMYDAVAASVSSESVHLSHSLSKSGNSSVSGLRESW